MSVIQITDLNDPQLDIYARLSEGQLLHYYEPDLGIFIAESPKVIQTAFEQGYEPISFLVEDRHIKTQAKDIILQYQDIPVYTASFDVLKQLTGFGLTRGMLCAMRRKPLPALETICDHAKRIVILENVMNQPTSEQSFVLLRHLIWMPYCLVKAAAIHYTEDLYALVWELFFRYHGHFLGMIHGQRMECIV